MAIQYDSLGSTVTITAQGTATTIVPFDAIAVVGGMDTSNGNANTGESTRVAGPTAARNEFGDDCELTRVIETMGGVDTIYGVPVDETTDSTESFSSTDGSASDDTLAEAPIFDPNVQPEHDISATDTSEASEVTVNIVYADTPSTPSDSNTMNLNPINGEWRANESSSYDITYDYGDYQTAIDAAVGEPIRYMVVCSEESGVKAYTVTTLQNEAANFNFKRAFTGAKPDIASADISNYTPDQENWRLIEVTPSRGEQADGAVRTMGAVAALAARQPIDGSGSITYDEVTGLSALRTKYAPVEAADFSQVTAMTREYEIAGGVTTSSDEPLRDIYAVEIIDNFTLLAYSVVKQYAGDPNTVHRRKNMASSVRQVARAMSEQRPPSLATGTGARPYSVEQSIGSSDDVAVLTVGIEPTPIMKRIDLNINVGDVVVYDGVSA